jgi:hypothetical protein
MVSVTMLSSQEILLLGEEYENGLELEKAV